MEGKYGDLPVRMVLLSTEPHSFQRLVSPCNEVALPRYNYPKLTVYSHLSCSAYKLARCLYAIHPHRHWSIFYVPPISQPTSMHLSILILIAVASATPLTLPKRDLVGTFPLIRALPIPSGNGTVNGFDSLGSLYTDSAGQLTSLANGIGECCTLESYNSGQAIQLAY